VTFSTSTAHGVLKEERMKWKKGNLSPLATKKEIFGDGGEKIKGRRRVARNITIGNTATSKGNPKKLFLWVKPGPLRLRMRGGGKSKEKKPEYPDVMGGGLQKGEIGVDSGK